MRREESGIEKGLRLGQRRAEISLKKGRDQGQEGQRLE